MSSPRFTSNGEVCWIPPTPDDTVDTFVEVAVAEFRKRGPRATLRGGLTLEQLQQIESDHEPFELSRRAQPESGVRQVKVCGILIGGTK